MGFSLHSNDFQSLLSTYGFLTHSILSYVRINFGNKASAVTVNEVKEARSKLK